MWWMLADLLRPPPPPSPVAVESAIAPPANWEFTTKQIEENANLRSQIERIEEEHRRTTKELAEESKANQDALRRDFEQVLQEQRQDQQVLAQALEASEMRADAARQEQARSQQEFERQQKENVERLNEVSRAREEDNARFAADLELMQRISAQETEAAREAMEAAQLEMDELSQEIERQAAEHKSKQDEICRELAEAIEQRKRDNEEFQSELSGMRAQAEQEREEHRQVMVEFRRSALESERNNIDGNLRDLKKQLKQVEDAFKDVKKDYEEIMVQIQKEYAKVMKHFKKEREDPSILSLVLIGMTGDGKSTLANRFVGDMSEEATEGPFTTSASIHSETQAMLKVLSEVGGVKLSVLDTPGLADSGGREREHVNNLIEYLRSGIGVNQFLVVKNMANPRLSTPYQQMLTRLDSMLGSEFWNYVTIVLTGVEGRAKKKYEGHKDELIRELERQYNCRGLKAFGIGFDDDWPQVIEKFVTQGIPEDKFFNENLKSPLNELEEQGAQLQPQVDEAAQEVERVQERMRQLEMKRADVEQQLASVGSEAP